MRSCRSCLVGDRVLCDCLWVLHTAVGVALAAVLRNAGSILLPKVGRQNDEYWQLVVHVTCSKGMAPAGLRAQCLQDGPRKWTTSSSSMRPSVLNYNKKRAKHYFTCTQAQPWLLCTKCLPVACLLLYWMTQHHADFE